MQSYARYSLSVIVAVFLLSLQVPAYAADYLVKNDSMGETFQGKTATAQLIAGEMYAATFELPASWQLPVELEGVRVLMVDGQDSTQTYCGRFTVEVWEEAAGQPTNPGTCPFTRVKDPGSVIYSMSNQFQSNPIGFEIKGDSNNWQDLRFSAVNNNPQLGVTINPVMLTTRKVRVAVKALDTNCQMGGTAFPNMVSDDDGVSADNYLYGEADLCGGISGTVPPPEFYYWTDFSQYFGTQPGDFIMRLIFDRPDGGTGDVGVDAGADAGKDAGMDAGVDTGADAGTDTDSDIGTDTGNGDIGLDAIATDTTPDVNPDTTFTPDSSAALAITSVSPSKFINTSSTDLAIVGRGFQPGAKVRLGATLIGVTETESGLIMATVPEGFAVGVHDVIVTNPDGETAMLSGGVEVTDQQPEQGDAGDVASTGQPNNNANGSGAAAEGCGCRTVSGHAGVVGSWAWVFGLLAALLVVLRRRASTVEQR